MKRLAQELTGSLAVSPVAHQHQSAQVLRESFVGRLKNHFHSPTFDSLNQLATDTGHIRVKWTSDEQLLPIVFKSETQISVADVDEFGV